jgi:glycosyltransferase involved in cell wall biosynthesis
MSMHPTHQADASIGPTVLPKYVVITPVRNEATHVGKTLTSMVAQTVKPAEWIIVNDGSTDGTEQIVSDYAARYSWIRLINREDRGFRQRGPGVVEAFYEGFGHLTEMDYEVIVKLDGDLSFDPRYFETLLEAFARNPRLGITGGAISVQTNGRWTTERSLTPWTLGPSKVYRRACFEAIGGLRRSLGWDGVDNWHAQMLGWEIGSDERLRVLHHRPLGAATGSLKSRVEQGQGAYYIGYHPLFMFARGIRRMVNQPYVIGGCAMIWGYVTSWLTRREQVKPELVRFVRRTQLRLLASLLFRSCDMDH